MSVISRPSKTTPPVTLVSLAVLTALLCAAVTHVHAARIKCWTNKEGVRECGNVVPPEYAQKGHKEVSKSGLTIKRHERAITAEEKAEREAKAEAERVAKIKAEKAERIERRRRVEQTALDRTLLDLYVTEEDLTLAHERKVQAIESTIKHRRSHIGKLEEQLAKFQKHAADKERAGQSVDDKTLGSINDVQRQIDDSELFIRKRYQEMEKLDVEYHRELARYRYLKNGGKVGSPVTS